MDKDNQGFTAVVGKRAAYRRHYKDDDTKTNIDVDQIAKKDQVAKKDHVAKNDQVEKKDQEPHLLQSTWTLWYHAVDNEDWSIKSYQQLVDIESVEDFWIVFNNIPDFSSGMYFLMRKDHLPIWESYEKKMHFLKYRTSKKQFYQQWVDLCKALIGETISTDSFQMLGASLSPKFKNLIIRLWTYHSSLSEINLNPALESAEEKPMFE